MDFQEKGDDLGFVYLTIDHRAFQDKCFEYKHVQWGAADLELHGSEKDHFPTLQKKKALF